MKKKFTKLAASIGIALTQSANADDAIENDYFLSDIDTQLFKQPLNMETPIFLAAHGSHSSHGSHGSHSSHRSGSTTPKPPKPPIYTPIDPNPTVYQSCPDSVLPYRKNTVRKVQNLMIKLNYLERKDITTMGIMGYSARSALKRLKQVNNISIIPGVMLDKETLSRMKITCYD
jgi:hypothetical protein